MKIFSLIDRLSFQVKGIKKEKRGGLMESTSIAMKESEINHKKILLGFGTTMSIFSLITICFIIIRKSVNRDWLSILILQVGEILITCMSTYIILKPYIENFASNKNKLLQKPYTIKTQKKKYLFSSADILIIIYFFLKYEKGELKKVEHLNLERVKKEVEEFFFNYVKTEIDFSKESATKKLLQRHEGIKYNFLKKYTYKEKNSVSAFFLEFGFKNANNEFIKYYTYR